MTQKLEAENSLMFKITLVPFGNISSPSSINDKKKLLTYYFFIFYFFHKSF